jgi:spore coat protein CotH
MNGIRRFGWVAFAGGALFLATNVGKTHLCAAEAAETKTAKTAKTNSTARASEDLFAKLEIHQLNIDLSDSAREALRHDPHHYVKATVQEGSRVYPDVGMRLKGGTNAPGIDKKPGFALKFNEFVKDQDFHGHTRILFNHSQSDPTYFSDTLASEIFRAVDVPSPRTTFAKVQLTGRDLGLYVVAEAVNKEFLGRYFKKAKGNLYEGSHADVTEKLEKDSGDDSKEQNDLKALARATKESDPAQRWTKLSPLLDLDRFIAFAAVEVLLWHRDGYVLDRNNYRIYHDPASEHLVFLPHDIDQLCAKVDGPLLPEWQGVVATAVMNTPQGRQKYLERMTQLLDSAYRAETVKTRLDALTKLVRPALPANDPNLLKAFDAAASQLQERITQRAAFLREELKRAPAAGK